MMNPEGLINFTVLGGGGEVGANCFLLSCNGHRILLDCGAHPKKEGYACLPAFDLLNQPPDAYFITHGHVDHCGTVPYLCRQFPGVCGHATLPTAHIMDRMLRNSVVVMDAMSRERGIEEYPLFDFCDVGYAMRFVATRAFGKPFQAGADIPVEATFVPAGHVLGGASVLLKFPGHTVFYTGDISQTRQFLMGGRSRLGKEHKVDTLIIESTLGATEEEDRSYEEEIYSLADAMREVLDRRGAVLLPSFALGRTQEMVNIVAQLQEEGLISHVPIYTVGLGRAIYELYDKFSEYLHPKATLRPLSRFERLGNVWESGVVRSLLKRPCIIVATSGMMMENTPSALIAQQMVSETRHGIFFVGYLDPDSLGYKLSHAEAGAKLSFELGRPPVEVQLRDIRQFRFSSHATRSALAAIIESKKPKNVIYVHGDPEALVWMRENTGNGAQSFMPAVGQTIALEA